MGHQLMRRYDRQIILPEIGIAGQQKLAKANILIIGAGGLGCPLLLYLAGAGIGHIGLIDNDVVEESNLHRQVLYHTADIGKYKSDVAAARLELFNPDVRFSSYPVRLTSQNAAELIGRYDLIIDGSDNFHTRYLVNDTCVLLKKPLVFGSIYQFEGQVSVFNLNGGPDYRSLYPEPPSPDEVPNCAESGVVGPLPGIIGSIMANEAIKIICDFGEVLSGQLFVFNALNNSSSLFKFSKAIAKKTNKLNTLVASEKSVEIIESIELERPIEPRRPIHPKKPIETEKPIETKKLLESKRAEELDLQTLEQWNAAGIPYQLIDVREADEYEANNIGGKNIPLYRLSGHLTELSDHQRIVFCCSAGKRSNIAIQLFKSQSKAELYSLIVPSRSVLS